MITDANLSHVLQILQILVILSGGLFFLYQIKAQIIVMSSVQENLTERLKTIEVEIKQLAAVTVDLARQGERMTALDLRMTNFVARMDEYIKLNTAFNATLQSSRRRKT